MGSKPKDYEYMSESQKAEIDEANKQTERARAKNTGGYAYMTEAQEKEVKSTPSEVSAAAKASYNANKAAGSDTGRVVQASVGGAGSGTQAAAATQRADIKLETAYDPTKDAAYMEALEALKTVQSGKPTYESRYQSEIDNLYEQISGREDFSYDVNEDALYQQYADLYEQSGKKAMEDTMGQAAALTGGYGSTYAQNAGQQTYDEYMTALNEIIPTLRAQARDEYDAEGAAMENQYAMLQDREAQDYSRYSDDYSRWQSEQAAAQDQADRAYTRAQEQNDAATEAEETNRERVMELIGMGIDPSDNELNAAGMTRELANAYKSYYSASGSESSGGSTETEEDSEAGKKTEFTEENINGAVAAYQNGGSTELYRYLDGLALQNYSYAALGELSDYVEGSYSTEDEGETGGTPFVYSNSLPKIMNGRLYYNSAR